MNKKKNHYTLFKQRLIILHVYSRMLIAHKLKKKQNYYADRYSYLVAMARCHLHCSYYFISFPKCPDIIIPMILS